MRIVVAMSGGVDSSVAAALLAEQGHDVIGLSMQLYPSTSSGQASSAEERFGSCCTLDDLNFSTLLDRALGLGAEYVATGHYARVEQAPDGRWLLKRSADPDKDQSYFLFPLTQEQLARAVFPVGTLAKPEVREEARRLGLAVADKPDSQEICFIPDGDYASFVERKEPAVARAGAIVDQQGRELGTHGGVHRFTVGQRKGLGIASTIPLYVLRIDADAATVTVGARDALEQTSLTASGVNWIAIDAPDAPVRVS